ncbi:MAG: Lrp/AsnC family transcriptional regulator [Actinomycetaceae bacterium]
MLTAIVMIEADVARIPEVAQQVADLDGIAEVYSVTGDFDLIAIARVEQHEALATVVSDRLGKVPGVTGTTTYLAFQAYSRRDLEQAFHIGLD